ncbi:DUF2267 domain-containing protein [Streptomyces sp. NPDC006356]
MRGTRHEEFIGQVQARARVDGRGAVERATRASLETLAERIPAGLAEKLAAQLPYEIAEHLRRIDRAPDVPVGGAHMSGHEFFERVAQREGKSFPKAVHHARSVIEVVSEAVQGSVTAQVRECLDDELATSLFAGSIGSRPPPRPAAPVARRSSGPCEDVDTPPGSAVHWAVVGIDHHSQGAEAGQTPRVARNSSTVSADTAGAGPTHRSGTAAPLRLPPLRARTAVRTARQPQCRAVPRSRGGAGTGGQCAGGPVRALTNTTPTAQLRRGSLWSSPLSSSLPFGMTPNGIDREVYLQPGRATRKTC